MTANAHRRVSRVNGASPDTLPATFVSDSHLHGRGGRALSYEGANSPVDSGDKQANDGVRGSSSRCRTVARQQQQQQQQL